VVQLPPVQAQLVAAGLQLAVSVVGEPSVAVVAPLTVQLGTLVTTQVNVCVPALNAKLSQFGSEKVRVAACEGDDAGTARKAKVNAAAAQVLAVARKSDRFIFDSQAEHADQAAPWPLQVPRQQLQ
jgi:hypothetical protein